MCVVCGCNGDGAAIEDGKKNSHAAGHHHDHSHGHDHSDHHHHHDAHDDHTHTHDHHEHHHATEPQALHVHAPGIPTARMIRIERDILAKNNAYATENRDYFTSRGILAINLLSSPGSGKTSLLVRTIEALAGRLPVSVIEGDQATTNDADRIRATGVPALQINTGKGCHLDAHMVGHALETLAPTPDGLLFIENVGNLVCPAAFDLGEAQKVVVLSVTEGEDKPLKYPDMFHAADLLLLNKIDLLPYLDFDVQKAIAAARVVNPKIRILQLSTRTGFGMEAWITWLIASQQREAIGRVASAPAITGALPCA